MPVITVTENTQGLTPLAQPVVYQSRAANHALMWGQKNPHPVSTGAGRDVVDDGVYATEFRRNRYICHFAEEQAALEASDGFSAVAFQGAFWRFTVAAGRATNLRTLVKQAGVAMRDDDGAFDAEAFMESIDNLTGDPVSAEAEGPETAGPAIIKGVKDTAPTPRRRGPGKRKKRGARR